MGLKNMWEKQTWKKGDGGERTLYREHREVKWGRGLLVGGIALGAFAYWPEISSGIRDLRASTEGERDGGTDGERGGGQAREDEQVRGAEGVQTTLTIPVNALDLGPDGMVDVQIRVPNPRIQGDMEVVAARVRPQTGMDTQGGASFSIRVDIPERILMEGADAIPVDPSTARIRIGRREANLAALMGSEGAESQVTAEASRATEEGYQGRAYLESNLEIGTDVNVTYLFEGAGAEMRSCNGTRDCSEGLAGVANADTMGAVLYRFQVVNPDLANGPSRAVAIRIPDRITINGRTMEVNPAQTLVRVGNGEPIRLTDPRAFYRENRD